MFLDLWAFNDFPMSCHIKRGGNEISTLQAIFEPASTRTFFKCRKPALSFFRQCLISLVSSLVYQCCVIQLLSFLEKLINSSKFHSCEDHKTFYCERKAEKRIKCLARDSG